MARSLPFAGASAKRSGLALREPPLDHAVHPLRAVHRLGDPEVRREGAERIGVLPAEAGGLAEERDHVAEGDLGAADPRLGAFEL